MAYEAANAMAAGLGLGGGSGEDWRLAAQVGCLYEGVSDAAETVADHAEPDPTHRRLTPLAFAAASFLPE